ncbi:MAG: TatD family hydrolase, partial [Muribaculaceae bacterium]|nr:TatD family hydrolase [Muribaculaceae bacterium]
MIDSHSHIYCSDFDTDRDEAMQRAQQAGVWHIVMPNENLASVPVLRATHERYPTLTSMALGL